jgi:hypothetical protein
MASPARDVDIAERLGFERPRKVRELIQRHRDELLAFGALTPHRGAKIGKGRPEEGFYLTEEQALLIATVSNAPNAPAVCAMLIRTFTAWRRGRLPAAFDIRAVGGMVKAIVNKSLDESMPVIRQQVADELTARNAVPTINMGSTVSAFVMIERAGISPEDRQRGTAQMVTGRMLKFCADRGVACFRAPDEINPARPYRFPSDLASE